MNILTRGDSCLRTVPGTTELMATRLARSPRTTLDQLFTEEQFEAYRNLGFHAVNSVFKRTDDDLVSMDPVPAQWRGVATTWPLEQGRPVVGHHEGWRGQHLDIGDRGQCAQNSQAPSSRWVIPPKANSAFVAAMEPLPARHGAPPGAPRSCGPWLV
jgi:hypothetical protein